MSEPHVIDLSDPAIKGVASIVYKPALIPGSNLWVPCCQSCGALVLNMPLHDRYHLG